MPDNRDPMSLTLDALRSDVERTPLADSLTVRRRGDQRTRRAAIGSAVAVVAVLAGVVGVAGGLTGDNRSAVPPAEQPTVSTSQEPLHDLAGDPLIQAGDIGTVGPNTGWKRSPEPVSESLRLLQCVTSPTTWGAVRTESAQYYNDLDGMVVEHAMLFSTAAAAQAAVQRALDETASCPTGDPADATVEDRPTEPIAGVGDGEAHRFSRLTTPTADAGIGYYELAVGRTRNLVVLLEWSSMGNPVGDSPADWVWNSERLGTALDRAID